MGYWTISWDTGDLHTESSNTVPTPERVVEFVNGLQNTGRRVRSVKSPDGRTWPANQISALVSQLEDRIGARAPYKFGQPQGAWA
jgi:hypothetical protein